MKTFTLITLLFPCIGFCFANSPILPPDSSSNNQKMKSLILIEQGKTRFFNDRIKESLIKFREAQQKDPKNWKAPYWIAKCHYQLNNYGYALKYAKTAQQQGGMKAPRDNTFILGQAYHRLEDLDSADFYYKKFLILFANQKNKKSEIQYLIDQVKYATESISKGKKIDRKRILGEVNSGYDDYGMITLGDSVAFLTARKSNTTGGNLNPSDERYFEDIYKIIWNPTSKTWENLTNELGKLNSDGFDAMNTITEDGLIAYITLNNTFSSKVKKTTRSSDIFEVKKNKTGKWNSPKPIKNKSINTSFFDGAATVTADGNTMYFVSDRKAEKSLTDIYIVEKIGNKWGEAKPLPEIINTKDRETTPFISPDGRFLFFASDGHGGMGGYDIYVSENKGGNEWSEPINLGYGINSVNNDTHFSYNSTTKKGYVSSYHIVGNKSSIDIYEIDFSTGMPFIKK